MINTGMMILEKLLLLKNQKGWSGAGIRCWNLEYNSRAQRTAAAMLQCSTIHTVGDFIAKQLLVQYVEEVEYVEENSLSSGIINSRRRA